MTDWKTYEPEGQMVSFRGEEAFVELYKLKRIRSGQFVKVFKYFQPSNDFYCIREDGLLEFVATPGLKPRPGTFKPEDILSRVQAENGWSIDSLFPAEESK